MKRTPELLEIHPTLACNLKCEYCSLRLLERYETLGDVATGLGIPVDRICNQSDVEYLTVEEFLGKAHISLERHVRVIEEAFSLGIKQFKISGGGEPLCRPNYTFALMEAISAGGASIELITNGTLVEVYIDHLLKIGLNILSISLDTASPEITDRRRGKKGTFSLIAGAIEKINASKKRMNADHPHVQVYSVLDEESIMLIPGLMSFAEDNNIERINFIIRKNSDISYFKELNCVVEGDRDFSVSSNIREIYAIVKENESDSKLSCTNPFNNIVIHGNGLVTPCCSMKWGGGEFIQNRSLKDIWDGIFFQATRDAFLNGDLPSYCINCKECRNGEYGKG